MTASKGTVLNPNLGASLKMKPSSSAMALVVCAALEDVIQTYIAASSMRWTGVRFLPAFSIGWSAYRTFGHGLMQCMKACDQPEVLVVDCAEKPLTHL